jgi:hypothetical protein
MLSSSNSDEQVGCPINGYTAVDTTGESGKTDKHGGEKSVTVNWGAVVLKTAFVAITVVLASAIVYAVLVHVDRGHQLIYDNTTFVWKIGTNKDIACSKTDRNNICVEEVHYTYYVVALVARVHPFGITCTIPYRLDTMEAAVNSTQTYSKMSHLSVRDGNCEDDRGRPICRSPSFWLAYASLVFLIVFCVKYGSPIFWLVYTFLTFIVAF